MTKEAGGVMPALVACRLEPGEVVVELFVEPRDL